MKKHTVYQKNQGDLAMRSLSEKAFKYYSTTDPLDVYEVETPDGEKRYDIKEGPIETLGLTFKELDEMFSDLREQIEREEAEEAENEEDN